MSAHFSWMVGSSWPSNGEIDIMEGINANGKNQMTLHSSPGCNVTVGQYGQTGTSGSSNQCGAGGGYNGCTVFASSSTSYGTGYNTAGGGVYALKWASDSIKIWQWNKGKVPADVTAGAPKPTGWGVPAASFAGCAFDSYFKQMNIVSSYLSLKGWPKARRKKDVANQGLNRCSISLFAVTGEETHGRAVLLARNWHPSATRMPHRHRMPLTRHTG